MPRFAGLTAFSAVALTLAGCATAGETELAFCDAKSRNDAAAAKAIFDAGAIDMTARNLRADCVPGRELFEAARPNAPVCGAVRQARGRRQPVLGRRQGLGRGPRPIRTCGPRATLRRCGAPPCKAVWR